MGMKQKLAIAVSLMNKPKFLILHEPTNGIIEMAQLMCLLQLSL